MEAYGQGDKGSWDVFEERLKEKIASSGDGEWKTGNRGRLRNLQRQETKLQLRRGGHGRSGAKT